MGKIIYLNTQIGGIETLPAAVGDGRTLGLSPIQFDTLKKNADSQIVLFRNQKVETTSQSSVESNIVASEPTVEVTTPETASNSVIEPVVPEVSPSVSPVENVISETPSVLENPEVSPVVPNVVTPEPVVSPVLDAAPVVSQDAPVSSTDSVINDIPVVDITTPVMEESASAPVIDTPVIPTPVEPEPVVSPVVLDAAPTGQVEIVSNTKENTDYDQLITRIEEINANYDKQIQELNQKRTEEIKKALEENKEKIAQYESKIKDLQGRAEEHLKNAQAAETIATIAQANAQNMEQSQDNNS